MRAQKSKGSDSWHCRARHSAHVTDRRRTRDILDFVEESLNDKDIGKIWQEPDEFKWKPEGLIRYAPDEDLAWSIG